MSGLSRFLPPCEDGLLPYWLLFISVVSIFNSIQAYCTLTYTARVYCGRSNFSAAPAASISPVTHLSARTFGTWTLIQSLVRFYAAYHITERAFYQLAFWTFAVAFGHFVSEWLIFRTTRWGTGLAGPVLVSTGTLIWMLLQWDFYIN
ncbi:unnamed protein product [Blumeria hordei]|uniref:Ergosterol biosynthetic protein 28 n=1 Tax=Blumeria hordei TaxID=2867405 RepID=A0A383UP36_BLUHO|nr:unnamed protein product [Blumeria hordei]